MSQMVPDGATADDGDDAAPPQECLPMLDSLLDSLLELSAGSRRLTQVLRTLRP